MTTRGSIVSRITADDFAVAFVPFGVLLGIALIAAETTLDLGPSRTVYTIWVATVLVTPALCAFALPKDSERRRRTWLLFWTFAFAAYLVHFAYSVFSVYHGSLRELLDGQGLFAAVNNAIFTLWWAFDLSLAWFYTGDARWVRIQRIAAHWYVGLTFFFSTVVLNHGFITVLGTMMTVAVLICLMIRFDSKRRVPALATE